MKKIIENFKKFINEKDDVKYQIFLDMDGVLVDMTKGYIDEANINLERLRKGEQVSDIHDTEKRAKALEKLKRLMDAEGREKITAAEFEHITFLKDSKQEYLGADKQIERYFYALALKNYEFWEGLPMMPAAEELVEAANKASTYSGGAYILSAPMDQDTINGKMGWIGLRKKSWLRGIKKIFIEEDKGGFLKTLELPANVTPILIDDRIKYVNQFRDSGVRNATAWKYNPLEPATSSQEMKNKLAKL